MMGCKKCQGIMGAGMLIAGILFLLRDLNIWNFWGIEWSTVLFLLVGVGTLAMRTCPDCQAMMGAKAKK